MPSFASLAFSNIKREIERYLQEEHNKAGILFSPASPYGQILSVIEGLHQLSMLYLKNTISQFDLGEMTSNNPRVIRSAAVLAGHSPTRAISATGTLKISLLGGVDIQKEIPGGRITLSNRLVLKNVTNGLDYSLNLGVDTRTFIVNPRFSAFLPIIQGKWTTSVFTSDGSQLQTFQLVEIGELDIENFNYEVLVNGQLWSIKKHIWDMLPDEQACVIKTGYTGGIDIIFGNGGFGLIPPLGVAIRVNYLQTNGSEGNIFRRTVNDWKFIDDVIDGNGESIDVTKFLQIDIFNDINFGTDKENLIFTKSILPIVSNNFVLGLPQQYAYEIKKLGVFSHVNAYEKTGTIFIVATPNIRLFKNQNADYFNVDLQAFTLDNYERTKIDMFLKAGGNMQLTTKYKITSPKLSFYVLNVYVISYSDATDDSVNSQILNSLSNYFLNLSRVDRIPKLDLIKSLSNIRDIHSIDIQFISKKNEDYHRENLRILLNQQRTSSRNPNISNNKKIPSYDPNKILGLDNIMGDILFDPDEIPVLRGGWVDRNDIFYADSVEGSGLKTVNIIKKGVVDSKNRPNI